MIAPETVTRFSRETDPDAAYDDGVIAELRVIVTGAGTMKLEGNLSDQTWCLRALSAASDQLRAYHQKATPTAADTLPVPVPTAFPQQPVPLQLVVGPEDVAAELRIQYRRDGAMVVGGHIYDAEWAQQAIYAAKDLVRRRFAARTTVIPAKDAPYPSVRVQVVVA